MFGRNEPIGPGLAVAFCIEHDIGLGSRHCGFGWMAATRVTSSFDEEEVAQAIHHLSAGQYGTENPVSLDDRETPEVVVIDDSDANWPKIMLSPDCQGIVPACVLERPIMDQDWQVELTGRGGEPLRGAPGGEILCREFAPSMHDCGDGTWFDLGKDSAASQEKAEWRAVSREGVCVGGWECVVRGLQPQTQYRIRIRSVVNGAGRGSAAGVEEVYGPWCDPINFETKRHAPALTLPQANWQECIIIRGRVGRHSAAGERGQEETRAEAGAEAEAEAEELVEFGCEVFEVAEEKALWRRWHRIRQPTASIGRDLRANVDTNGQTDAGAGRGGGAVTGGAVTGGAGARCGSIPCGMDVLWWMHPTKPRRDGGFWQVAVKLERSSSSVAMTNWNNAPTSVKLMQMGSTAFQPEEKEAEEEAEAEAEAEGARSTKRQRLPAAGTCECCLLPYIHIHAGD